MRNENQNSSLCFTLIIFCGFKYALIQIIK